MHGIGLKAIASEHGGGGPEVSSRIEVGEGG